MQHPDLRPAAFPFECLKLYYQNGKTEFIELPKDITERFPIILDSDILYYDIILGGRAFLTIQNILKIYTI